MHETTITRPRRAVTSTSIKYAITFCKPYLMMREKSLARVSCSVPTFCASVNRLKHKDMLHMTVTFS
jgi:hypothetical protein